MKKDERTTWKQSEKNRKICNRLENECDNVEAILGEWKRKSGRRTSSQWEMKDTLKGNHVREIFFADACSQCSVIYKCLWFQSLLKFYFYVIFMIISFRHILSWKISLFLPIIPTFIFHIYCFCLIQIFFSFSTFFIFTHSFLNFIFFYLFHFLLFSLFYVPMPFFSFASAFIFSEFNLLFLSKFFISVSKEIILYFD